MKWNEPALPDGPTLDVDEQGQRIVLAADDRIRMILHGLNRLLEVFGAQDPIEVGPDGTVTLDSAGVYRYRLVERDRWRREVGIYERVPGTSTGT